MKPTRNPFFRSSTLVVFVFAVPAILSQTALADQTWKNTGTDFNAGGSWVSGTAPIGTDYAIFSGASATNPNLSSSLSILGLNFSTTLTSGYTLSASPSQSLTLTSTGTGISSAINAANNSGTNTISAPIILGTGAATFTQKTGGTLFISGSISGPSTTGLNLTSDLNAAGAIYKFSNPNTYTFGTTVSTGALLQVGVDSAGSVGSITSSAIGKGTLTFAGGGISSDGATARTILNAVTFSGDAVLGDATNTGKLTFSAAANLGGAIRQITVNSSAQFDGIISNGSLTKGGTGTLTLANSNSFTGNIVMNASSGILRVTNSGALGTGSKTFTNLSTGVNLLELDSNGGSDITLGSNITFDVSGSSGVIQNTAGNNTIAGLVQLDNGNGNTKIISNGGSLTLSGNVAPLASKTLDLSGTSTGSNLCSGNLVFNGAVLSLLKSGTGTWTISSNSNNYTGTTTVQAGTLIAGASSAFGNTTTSIALGNGSTIATDAPTLLLSGTVSLGRNLDVGNGAASTYNATIGGSNTSGTTTYTGNITLNTGGSAYTTTLQAATGGTVEFKTGTWTTNNKAVAIGSAGNTGTVKLSNNLVTTGGVAVNNGTLLLGATNALGSSATPVTIGTSGTLDVSGFADSIKSLSMSGSASLKLAVGNQLTSANAVALAGSVNVAGNVDDVTGKYTLITSTGIGGSPTYTYTGLAGTNPGHYVAKINGTSLDLQHMADQSLTSASPATINIISGSTIAVGATLANTAPVNSTALVVSLGDNSSTGGTLGSFTGTGPVSAGGTLSVGATLTAGTPGLGKTWSLKNTDANAITTSVNAGGTVNVYSHSAPTLTVATGNNQTIITGGSFTSATATLSNAAGTVPAPLDVSASPTNLTGATGSGVVASGGSGTYTATGFINNVVGAGKSLNVSLTTGDQQTITGASAMTAKNATFTYNVQDHANAVGTPVTLNLGTVHAGYGSIVNSGNNFTVTNGTSGDYRANLKGTAGSGTSNVSINSFTGLQPNGTSQTIQASLTTGIAGGTILNQNISYVYADDSLLSGASANLSTISLAVTGQVYSGNMIWNGASNTSYGSASDWNDSANASIHAAPGLDAGFTGVDSATFGNTSGTVTVRLDGSSPSLRNITFNNTGSYTLSQGSGGIITMQGTTPTITAAGTHVISAPVLMGSDVTATVSSGSLTVTGLISGSGIGLTKDGSGSLTLTNTGNTYSGPTTVKAGSLIVDGNISTGLTTVKNSGTLSGTGTLAGDVAVESGGTVDAGVVGVIGTLTAKTAAFQAGSNFQAQINTASGPTPTADKLKLTGTTSGTLSFDLTNLTNLVLSDLGSNTTMALRSRFILADYNQIGATWNGGLLKYADGNDGVLRDGEQFTAFGNMFAINYDDVLGGSPGSSPFGGDNTNGGKYLTLTVVPESSAALLGGIGMLFLLRRRRTLTEI